MSFGASCLPAAEAVISQPATRNEIAELYGASRLTVALALIQTADASSSSSAGMVVSGSCESGE
jgi:hypothetical protein